MYPVLFRIGQFEIPSFGVMLAIGILLAWFYFKRQFGPQINEETLGSLVTLSIFAGLAGARINYILEHLSDIHTIGDLGSMLISRSGLTVFGGVLAGIAAGAFYAHRKKLPVWPILDAGALSICIGYFWGRLGCQLAGDGDYGIPTNLPWGMSYPVGTVPTLERVHPTPVYEMLLIAAIFAILTVVRKRTTAYGVVFSTFLILAGIERFFIEFIRMNPTILFGLTEAQLVSAALIIAGILILKNQRRVPPFIRMKAQ